VRAPPVRLGCLLLALAAAWPAPRADADVSPGDVVTADDRQVLRGLVPEEVWPFAVEGFDALRMEIVATQPYPVHPKYLEATVRHACQTRLDDDGQLVGYTAGQPFPWSEWAQEATGHACDLRPDDPQLGLKLAWNANHRWGGGEIHMGLTAQSFWRARGDNTWRIATGVYRRTWFSHRADLLPGATRLVPDTDMEWAEYLEMLSPFDMRGTAYLVYRYRNSRERPDDAWMYVPSLRRVRRVPTAEKADSIQGSDYTLEDFMLFSGYVWDQEWRFAGEETLLAAMDTRRRCYPLNVEGRKSDGTGELGERREFDACRFGPYSALPFVDETWEKRVALRLEQVPLRVGHPYGRRIVWYDKETFWPLMALSYDREGVPFRLMWYLGNWSETAGTPGSAGLYTTLVVSSSVVNLKDGVSNLTQSFATDGELLAPDEAESYYDATRLKKRR
jgi:hypothetical protein